MVRAIGENRSVCLQKPHYRAALWVDPSPSVSKRISFFLQVHFLKLQNGTGISAKEAKNSTYV